MHNIWCCCRSLNKLTFECATLSFFFSLNVKGTNWIQIIYSNRSVTTFHSSVDVIHHFSCSKKQLQINFNLLTLRYVLELVQMIVRINRVVVLCVVSLLDAQRIYNRSYNNFKNIFSWQNHNVIYIDYEIIYALWFCPFNNLYCRK